MASSTKNPFSTTPSLQPGQGEIHLALLPPQLPRLRTLQYQYPLKLIAPSPLWTAESPRKLIHTVYVLTYGGGLVAGDALDLSIKVEAGTRLLLLTQGSTKIFKSVSPDVTSVAVTRVRVEGDGAAVVYLPDPVLPFRDGSFVQTQVYDVVGTSRQSAEGYGRTGGGGAKQAERVGPSLCVLDWVCSGRVANGENWSFFRYGSKNEIYVSSPQPSSSGTSDGSPVNRRLLLRDNLLLDSASEGGTQDPIASRMNGLAVFGTLILYGPLFTSLGAFFLDEYHRLPRIGGRKWDGEDDEEEEEEEEEGRDGNGRSRAEAASRTQRQARHVADGVLWTAASVRGCVVVKLGARDVEGGKRFWRTMLEAQGSVVAEFGERALLCLR